MKGPGVTREVLIHSGPSNALLGEIGRVVPKSSMSSWYGFSVLDCYHRQISPLQSMVSPRWRVTNVRASLTLLQKLALLGVLSLKTDHDQQP